VINTHLQRLATSCTQHGRTGGCAVSCSCWQAHGHKNMQGLATFLTTNMCMVVQGLPAVASATCICQLDLLHMAGQHRVLCCPKV
jgi:hypothetical protein